MSTLLTGLDSIGYGAIVCQKIIYCEIKNNKKD